jgi:2-amino-4-hydroxy-6-hydroxymethyldihydropteridine diphosphokinase
MLETDLAPAALLETAQRVEQALGRVRAQSGYLSRTLDVDILLFGNFIIDLPELSIPHPLMTERMFVLQPLAELAPDAEHPVSHLTMACLRDRCGDKLQVRLFDNG